VHKAKKPGDSDADQGADKKPPKDSDDSDADGNDADSGGSKTKRDKNGKLRDEKGRFVDDPEAGGDRKPTHKATKTKQDNAGAKLDPNNPETAAAIKRRNDANAERDAARARGDEEGARKAQAKANKATEELGQQATDAYMKEKYPDAKKMHQGEGRIH
jgi:hypothetical protein